MQARWTREAWRHAPCLSGERPLLCSMESKTQPVVWEASASGGRTLEQNTDLNPNDGVVELWDQTYDVD